MPKRKPFGEREGSKRLNHRVRENGSNSRNVYGAAAEKGCNLLDFLISVITRLIRKCLNSETFSLELSQFGGISQESASLPSIFKEEKTV